MKIMFLNKKLTLWTTLLVAGFVSTSVNAAISLDRTRVIFNANEDSMTVNISNDNKVLPYLAQAWLEDENMKKMVTGPLIVTPPVQRVEPGEKSRILISKTGLSEKLPNDRESIYYFNVREIPPKSEKANVLQIALQTKIKLFYRPDSIQQQPNAVWQDKLIFTEIENGYEVNNPTPFYITVVQLEGKGPKNDNQQSFMIAPKSKLSIKSKHYSSFNIAYINDYGGRPEINFTCKDKVCTFSKL